MRGAGGPGEAGAELLAGALGLAVTAEPFGGHRKNRNWESGKLKWSVLRET